MWDVVSYSGVSEDHQFRCLGWSGKMPAVSQMALFAAWWLLPQPQALLKKSAATSTEGDHMTKTKKEIIGAMNLANEGALLHKRERRRPMKPIEVSFDLSGRNEPLVTFVKSPLAFCDLQLGPQQLRNIAAALMKIADDSESLGLTSGELRRSYPV